MTEPRPPSPWRLPVVLLLAITLPPLAIVAWILLSGDQRKIYWQSWCVKGGLAIAVIGSLRGQAGLDDFLECKHIAFKPGKKGR